MKARYIVNQLNRVHESLVTASLDRGLIQNADEDDRSYLQMPPTLKLEFTPDAAPQIGTRMVVTVEPVVTPGIRVIDYAAESERTHKHLDPYTRKTITAELELEIPPGREPVDAIAKVVDAINAVAMNSDVVAAWTVEPD